MPKINLNTAELLAEKQAIAIFLAEPNAFSSPDFGKKNKRFSELEVIIEKASTRDILEKQLMEAKSLSGGGDELAELAKSEIPEIEEKINNLDEELFIMLAPKDPNDGKNVIIEIRAGGDEASPFAGELYCMYLRWREAHSMKTDYREL